MSLSPDMQFFSVSAPSNESDSFLATSRVLEWNARSYLGSEMYRQWQDSLVHESLQKERREARRERMVQKKDRKLLRLQRKLHKTQTEEASSRRSSTTQSLEALETPRRLSSVASLEDYKAQKLDITPTLTNTSTPDNDPDILASPTRRGGLLSRLARQKNESHGKDMDKVVSKGKEMKHSVSVPNLRSSSLNMGEIDLFHTIHEAEHEDGLGQMSDDGGLFV